MSKLSIKSTSLNPNAAEFVPSFLKSPAAPSTVSDANRYSAKVTLDRTESSKSNNSDDESRRFWQSQLPDDIIPDFSLIEKDEHETEITELPPLGNLTLNASKDLFSGVEIGNFGFTSSGNSTQSAYNWEQYENSLDDLGFVDGNSADNSVAADVMFDPLEYLVSQFPGFSAQSLTDLYYANGCDLNVTVETLIQLEMQVDTGSTPKSKLNSNAPSFTMGDFPALTTAETQDSLSSNGYRSPVVSAPATDFASAVRKIAFRDAGLKKIEKSVGSSRVVSQITSRQYSANNNINDNNYSNSNYSVRAGFANKSAPVWLETGEAVANMYSESREEARDYARLRNACFDQARQAYLIGNKALAKELSVKGQLYNLQMKAAHGKAKESIYRQRNPIGQGLDQLIDLHGLHVNEALHILRQELGILKSTARATGERIQVMICVGTGHHTKGSRTPARLPIAVEQFLLGEGLNYTQPQPGLLRVAVY